MNLTTLNTTEAQIQIEDVITYLEEQGWQPIPHPNPRIKVLQGEEDDFGKPIQAVLPASMDFPDSQMLLDKVINLLAVLEDKTPQEIVTAIKSEDDPSMNYDQEVTTESTLTGKALLDKVQELERLGSEQIALKSGYYTTQGNKRSPNLTKFYEALLEAKGVPLSSQQDDQKNS